MPLTLSIALLCGFLFGSLLLFASASKAALALIGLASAITVMRRPLLGFLLFAFVACCLPFSTVNLGIRITISEALLGLTWLAVAWHWLRGAYQPVYGRTEKWVAALLVFSLIPFVVGQVSIHADGNGVVNWVRWVLNVSPLFLVPLLIDTPKKRDQLLVMLLLGNLLMLLVSIFMFLKSRNALDMLPLLSKLQYAHPAAVQDIFSANYTRMGSPWVHPNLTGGAVALFLPLALFYGISQVGWRRTLGFSTAGLAALALLFSISRGAMVSLALLLMWYAHKRVPYMAKTMVIGSVLVVMLMVFYPPLQQRLTSMFSSDNASTQIRGDEYRKLPSAVAQYPLGIGFKIDPPVPNSDLLGISNLWLNYMYKMGLIGMLLFIAVTWAWWREVKPIGKITEITPENALWLSSMGSILAALGTGLFDHYYSFTMVLVALFWMLMGINLQQAREKSDCC